MSADRFDFSALTPVERIALADLLYDSAMQEIETMSPKQLAEVDRRIADIETGKVERVSWDDLPMRINP
jgi:putative addiction module component (TIGR02574 family)